MKIAALIFAFTILISVNTYVMIRGWQALPVGSVFRPIYLISMIILFLSMFVGMIFSNYMSPLAGKAVSFIGYTYMIIFVYLFLSFLVVDVIRLANYFIHFSPNGLVVFRLWAFAASLLIIGVALVVGNYNFNHPKVVTLNLTSDKPTQNKTLNIVAVSDLHLGVSIDKKLLKKYVAMINEQKPDIVFLAGDISDRSIEPLIKQKMDEEFRLINAPLGVYAINGNHEHYAESMDATPEFLKSANIKVLRDEINLVDSSFYVIGRDDRSNKRRKKLSEIVSKTDINKTIILLDHQPYNLEEAEQNNIDLQISGHTHNGQYFPGNIFIKRMYELAHGYMKKGSTHYYVSSGLGIWGPQYRIGSQSEVVVINMKY